MQLERQLRVHRHRSVKRRQSLRLVQTRRHVRADSVARRLQDRLQLLRLAIVPSLPNQLNFISGALSQVRLLGDAADFARGQRELRGVDKFVVAGEANLVLQALVLLDGNFEQAVRLVIPDATCGISSHFSRAFNSAWKRFRHL